MLYVFLVDTGTMLTFDMNLAVESVRHLQDAISDDYQISVDKQVLLISGGENLDPSMRVCSYSAGTDTNPIYLFSKSTIESSSPPSPSVYGGSDGDLKYQVEGSLNMPATYETVISRVQLSLQMHDLAKDEVICCESLVHDQHLQQQGWAAVVANLEDISSAFQQRSNIFRQNFEEFLKTRAQYFSMLHDFRSVLALLLKLPLLPCLTRAENTTDGVEDLSKSVTLLQWISNQDQRSSLQQMAEQCVKALEQFDESVLTNMMAEIKTALDAVDNPGMKEIKGLGDRLFGLEQLMAGAKKIVQEQGDMAQGFVQNQARVSNLNDPSILPDLCTSHQKQLMVMLKNHSQLRDIKRRCILAKEELSINLHARLRWIMYVEKQISDIDSKMVIYHENLKRLRRRLEVIEQIYLSPKLYAMAVVEVYRRRTFAGKFIEWATKLSDECSHIQGEEITRRMEFAEVMGKHFLHTLFPGLDDYPSSFVADVPESFDTRLPVISANDITKLRDLVPELNDILKVPNVEDIKEDFDDHHQKVLSLKNLTDRSPIKELAGDSEITLVEESASLEKRLCKLTDNKEDDSKRLSLSFEKVENVCDEFQTMSEELSSNTMEEFPEQSADSLPFVSLLPDNDEFLSASQSLLTDTTVQMERTMVEDIDIDDLQSTLMKKSIQLVKTQDDLSLMKGVLQQKQEQAQKLSDMLDETKVILKSDFENLKDVVENSKHVFSTLVKEANVKFTTALKAVQELEEEKRMQLRDEIGRMKQEHDDVKRNLETRLQEQEENSQALEKEKQEYENQLKSSVDNAVTLQEHYEVKLVEIKASAEDEKMKTIKVIREELLEQINDLEIDVKAKEKVIAQLALEKEKVELDLTERFESQSAELEQKVMEEAATKYERDVELLEERMASQKKDAIDEMRLEFSEMMEKTKKDAAEEKEELAERLNREIEEKFTEEMRQLQENMVREKQREMEELREQLGKEHENEMTNLKTKYESEKSEYFTLLQTDTEKEQAVSKMEESFFTDKQSSVLSAVEEERRKYEELINKLRADYAEEREHAIAAAVDLERQKHNADIQDLVKSYEKDKLDSLTNMRTSIQAEKQISFNEAVSKVTIQKTKIIEDLKCLQEQLLQAQVKDKETIANLLSGTTNVDEELQKALTDTQQTNQQLRQRISELETNLGLSERKVEVLEGRVPLHRERPPSITDNPLSASAHSDITFASLDSRDRIHMLEVTLRAKEEECTTLNQRLMQLTKAASIKADKVTIKDFSIGDIVLVCFDEYRDNYVVFTMGPTLYFIHSDSVSGLKLIQQPGQERKLWVLAQITDKEYCQAKKAQNRFKVPPGTKFYRVKAVPWPKK